jgi:hypothetical protein
VEYLNSQKVVFGIDEDALARMIEDKVYRREVCVAKGEAAVNGRDGVLTYQFDTEMNNKPAIRADGSVDYWSIHSVELVQAGDVIATCTDPTESKNGMTVGAKPILAKKGRPVPPLRGKGFSVSADGHTYVADIDGKIELVNGTVRISEVYEISGDVGLETGNVDFRGDVVIHGNVTPGAMVKATGSITVDGICENCTLDAGKDIILRGGVLGGYKTSIHCGGDIHAKFFEYCEIHADGAIEAESALDSRLESYETISMMGKKASLVGGSTYATRGIAANNVGNASEVKTEVQVGVSTELLKDMYNADKKKSETEDLIRKISAGLQQYDELAAQRGVDVSQDARRVALFRTRMMKQAEVAALQKEISRISEIMERGNGATVNVIQNVYPGTTVMIGSHKNALKEQQSSVQFKLREENVIMLSLAGELA